MIEIIPAIDIIEGRCVRLSQGDYNQMTTYREDPLEVAMEFEANGIKRLHLVDLDGAKAKHIVNWRVLERIANRTRLVIDFGGGLKSSDDLKIAFSSGAAMITGGSIAVKDPETFQNWVDTYSGEKIILGADAKDNRIAVTGWTEDTDMEIGSFIKQYVEQGISKVISTDISRDGMLTGPSTELYKTLLQEIPGLYLIASGGVSSFNDITELEANGVPAVITGKAIYEGRISLKDINRYILNA
ncbi:1-(5-phosphoribosyl)-5-[(5-phosphoribosylamino)methylideneamino]imidazole-4-carboxamide isomerase [Saccharicrinis sp. FJH54]|uniref:1-(5-phosphoribosyl)-5-[(5- phosphoribosylamino)methylideneamino]imidazole-4- carboxamide isomerase n=1 Tax=Saccharicrinis sp. FJH54 TaxID=3344665 RepID=UPI0035D44F4C